MERFFEKKEHEGRNLKIVLVQSIDPAKRPVVSFQPIKVSGFFGFKLLLHETPQFIDEINHWPWLPFVLHGR